MADTNPAHWLAVVEVIGLGVGGIISATLPTWLMNRHEDRKEAVEGKGTPTASAPALADDVVERLRKVSFRSEERIKEAIRDVHRDVNELEK